MTLLASIIMGGGALTSLGIVYAMVLRYLSSQQVAILYQPVSLMPGHDDHIPVLPLVQSRAVLPEVSFSEAGSCASSPEAWLRGWVHHQGHPDALIYYGGSSESVELRRRMLAQAFPRHTIYVVPYRGFGPNTGFVPNEAVLKRDAEMLFQYVARQHRHVDVIGRSLGTSIATHVSARHPIRNLALITPFDSVLSVAKERYRWAPVKMILRDWHEVWKDISYVRAPLLACLAEHDVITPHKFWNNLKNNIRGTWEEVFETDTDHNTIAQKEGTWDRIAVFFAQHQQA